MSFEEAEPGTIDGIPASRRKFTLEADDSDTDEEAYETDYGMDTFAPTPVESPTAPSQEAELCSSDSEVVDRDNSGGSDNCTLAPNPVSPPIEEESSTTGVLDCAPSTTSSTDTTVPVEDKAMEPPISTMLPDTPPPEQEEDDEHPWVELETLEYHPPPYTQTLSALDVYFSQGGRNISTVRLLL